MKLRIFPLIGYLYIVLPILIFFIGWCNNLTATVGTLIIIASLYFSYKNAPKLWIPKNKKELFFLFSLFLIALVWTYLAGIGALAFQNFDHSFRNTIFELLVSRSWPVYNDDSSMFLSYYIAFWLPSAVVGKVFNSVPLGYYFQIIWASLGIFLFFYYVIATLKKKSYIPILIFIFFSGLDFFGHLLFSNYETIFDITAHMDWWLPNQFSSMTTHLFWVFNQAIAAWLIVAMLNLEQNNKNILFLYSCLFLHSTLPAIGIFPFIIYWCIKNGKNSFLNLKSALTSLITFQNIIGSIYIFIVIYTYLSSNIAGTSIEFKVWTTLKYFLIFILFEVGIYMIIIFNFFKKDIMYYIALFCFLLYPFVYIGNFCDFTMRGTIPALVVLYLMICRVLQSKFFIKKCKIGYIILIFSLFIGAITPIHEIARTVVMTRQGTIKTNLVPIYEYNNYIGLTTNSKFLKYFGKQN